MVIEAKGLLGGLPLPLEGLLGKADGTGWSQGALLDGPLVLAACPDALLYSSTSASMFLALAGVLDAGAWVGIGESERATLWLGWG